MTLKHLGPATVHFDDAGLGEGIGLFPVPANARVLKAWASVDTDWDVESTLVVGIAKVGQPELFNDLARYQAASGRTDGDMRAEPPHTALGSAALSALAKVPCTITVAAWKDDTSGPDATQGTATVEAWIWS